jgi:RNA polymerase sigma-70 factor, ECF subfamily
MLTIQMIMAENPPGSAVSVDDDALLVRRAQKDAAAFGELFQRHHTLVYRYLLARMGNVHDAQDLTSQTFLAAMESLPRFRGQSPFVGWLLGIARHKMVDHLRQRRPDVELDVADDVADGEAPDEVIGRQLQLELVARKLQVLAPDRAEALSLRLFGGLEVAEIARIMGKNEAAVRMLVFRGLHDLQEQLQVAREEK